MLKLKERADTVFFYKQITPVQSLLFSVLLHLIIFGSFIFTFPVYPAPKRPEFIFLGAILTHQDVSILPDQNLSKTTPDAKEFTNKIVNVDITKKHFKNLRAKKTVTLKKLKANEKIILKSIFDASSNIDEKKGKTENEDIGIKIKIMPYNQLKLQ